VVKKRIGHLYPSTTEAADDPQAPQAAFRSRHSRAEVEAVVRIPFYIRGFVGAWAVVSTGGALAAAIAATILGGAIGGGLGGLVALAVARRHTRHVQEQLGKGGLVVWVTTLDSASEKKAAEVLQRCDGSAVRIHQTAREWGLKDRPLHDAQFDPLLLERAPRVMRTELRCQMPGMNTIQTDGPAHNEA
jgi:hypothetical protein